MPIEVNTKAGWQFAIRELAQHVNDTPTPISSALSNNKVDILGDSITAQCSTELGTENYGYITWACQLSRQRFRFDHTGNFGVGGDTTTDILARMSPVLASDSSTVVLLAGTNDRGGAAMTYQQTVDNLANIRDQLIEAGKIVILVAPLPRGDTTFTNNRLSGVQLANHIAVRQWVLDNTGIAGVYPVDPWPTMALASSTTGDLIVGMTHDGLHPNTTGAFYLGKSIAAVMENILPAPSILAATNTDQFSTDNTKGSAVVNPMFSGITGTPATGGSGQLADGWAGTNATGTTDITRVYSKVTSGGKDWQQCVIGGGPATAAGAIDIARQISLQAKVTPGTLEEAIIEYEVDAGSANVMSLQLGIAITTAQGTTTVWDADRYTGSSTLPNVAFSGILRTPKIEIPEGATDVRYRLSCYVVSGQSPSMTVRFRAASMRKVEE